jgi:hypothetical protein
VNWVHAPGTIPTKVKAAVMTWRKNRAFRLVKADLEQALTYRDIYWQGRIEEMREELSTPAVAGAIPPKRLKDLIFLCHPDKHKQLEVACETTQWLLAMRKKAA